MRRGPKGLPNFWKRPGICVPHDVHAPVSVNSYELIRYQSRATTRFSQEGQYVEPPVSSCTLPV
jgi:hypothetical protein